MPSQVILEEATATKSPEKSSALIEYPCSSDMPMTEGGLHLQVTFYTMFALKLHLQHRSDIYIGGNMFVYYREGDKRAVVSPDVFVALGVEGGERQSYKVWESGKAPDFVLEVASRSTHRRDATEKRSIYAAMGVKEFWRFDPTGEYFEPRLQALALDDRCYRQLAPSGEEAVRSDVLGVEIRVEGGSLRLRDLTTGLDIRTEKELDRALWESEKAYQELAIELSLTKAQAAREESARHEAEARLRQVEERLRESEERLRESEQGRREAEEGRREAEEGRREAEEGRRRAEEGRRRAEARVAEFEARYGKQKTESSPPG